MSSKSSNESRQGYIGGRNAPDVPTPQLSSGIGPRIGFRPPLIQGPIERHPPNPAGVPSRGPIDEYCKPIGRKGQNRPPPIPSDRKFDTIHPRPDASINPVAIPNKFLRFLDLSETRHQELDYFKIATLKPDERGRFMRQYLSSRIADLADFHGALVPAKWPRQRAKSVACMEPCPAFAAGKRSQGACRR